MDLQEEQGNFKMNQLCRSQGGYLSRLCEWVRVPKGPQDCLDFSFMGFKRKNLVTKEHSSLFWLSLGVHKLLFTEHGPFHMHLILIICKPNYSYT